jgi:hypothetical protein
MHLNASLKLVLTSKTIIKVQKILPPVQSLNSHYQRLVPFGYSTIEISGNFDITLSKYTNPMPICQEKILYRFPYISPWKLPGGLRNSREKEIKKNLHRDDFCGKGLNLNRKGLKKICHRDDSNARQDKLNNPPI